MQLTKGQIRERLITRSTWITNAWGSLFPDLAVDLPEQQLRYVVYVGLTGNQQNTVGVALRLIREAVAGPALFSPIPVAPAAFVQIPQSHDIEDPIIVVEGGGNLQGQADVTGLSVNVTVQYWDHEI